MSRGGSSPPSPRSWGEPGCPECETDVFVVPIPHQSRPNDHRCLTCGCRFTDAEGLSDRDLEQRRGGV